MGSRFRLTFKRGVIVALLILTLGNGFALTWQQRTSHAECVDRNRRAVATAPALAKLVQAARADGDIHMAKVWEQYQRLSQSAPIPKC